MSTAAVSAATTQAESLGIEVTRTFENIGGYTATMTAAQSEQLQSDPAVAMIEQDQVMRANETTWGIDRIDQRDLPLDDSYDPGATGEGVTAYIIDTGIHASHSEFGGRVGEGFTSIEDGNGTEDCNGHGTHVAGTVGGATYGVAPEVALVPVRVLGCDGSGSNSGVIAGMDWVAENASGASVANMSLGGGASSATDEAVDRMTAAGVSTVVAAGNENADACDSSPARAASAVTVGATNDTDARADFSNWGSCLDIFAPGEEITSAWYTGDDATNTISGTSMASPHVAGVAALYLQGEPAAGAEDVAAALTDTASADKVSDPGSGSVNKLVYAPLSDDGGDPDPDPDPEPEPGECSAETTGSVADYEAVVAVEFTAEAGTHQGCLTGPADADFDLYLQKSNGSGWTTVAYGESYGSDETVDYDGDAGEYRWVVASYTGSGDFTLKTLQP